jgi:hypothetical protein
MSEQSKALGLAGAWDTASLNDLSALCRIGVAMAEELRRLAAIESEYMAMKAQEPVAWRTYDGEGGYDYRCYKGNEDYAKEWCKSNPRLAHWVEPMSVTSRAPSAPTPAAWRARQSDEWIGWFCMEKQHADYLHYKNKGCLIEYAYTAQEGQ